MKAGKIGRIVKAERTGKAEKAVRIGRTEKNGEEKCDFSKFSFFVFRISYLFIKMQGREKNISVKHFFVIKLSSGGLGKSSVFFWL